MRSQNASVGKLAEQQETQGDFSFIFLSEYQTSRRRLANCIFLFVTKTKIIVPSKVRSFGHLPLH